MHGPINLARNRSSAFCGTLRPITIRKVKFPTFLYLRKCHISGTFQVHGGILQSQISWSYRKLRPAIYHPAPEMCLKSDISWHWHIRKFHFSPCVYNTVHTCSLVPHNLAWQNTHWNFFNVVWIVQWLVKINSLLLFLITQHTIRRTATSTETDTGLYLVLLIDQESVNFARILQITNNSDLTENNYCFLFYDKRTHFVFVVYGS